MAAIQAGTMNVLVEYILHHPPAKHETDVRKFRRNGRDLSIGGENDDDNRWLGRHQDMNSPGRITLHRARLCSAFWACIGDLQTSTTASTIQPHHHALCQSLIYMVITHERFHHFCDVIGTLAGYRGGERASDEYKKDWQTEEALATVWEWQEVQRNFAPFASLPEHVRSLWLDWWFDAITAKGYRDWKLFSHSCFFKHKLASHLIKDQARLGANGFDAQQWLYKQLTASDQFEASVSYWIATDDATSSAVNNIADRCEGVFQPTVSPESWIESQRAGTYLCNRGPTVLDEFEGMSSSSICLNNNQLTSLKDIHKRIESVEGILCARGNPIESHVLGLMRIKGLTEVALDNVKVQDILNKFLPNTKGHAGVLVCQSELLDTGFEEYAQL